MIGLEDRRQLARHIQVTHPACARPHACEVAGIDARTLQRWKAGCGLSSGGVRPGALRPTHAPALTPGERRRRQAVANEPRIADQPPARIVPALADEGVSMVSGSTMQRVLRAQGQNRRRGRAPLPRPTRPPSTHVATAPRQLWCWDMSYLPAAVLGRWYDLDLILDVVSRKIVGFDVHDAVSTDHAVRLLERTALAEGLHALPHRPARHSDNGATLKATTVLAMLHWLGRKPS